MFGYYLAEAVRNLRRNASMTLLMVLLIGIGIGASMTTLTIFRAMSGDPIPQKSAQLFTPQIDICGPRCQRSPQARSDGLPDQLTYIDAVALMRLHAAARQAAMYATGTMVVPSDPQIPQLSVLARATYADFFSMFNLQFAYGAPWTAADDDAHAAVAVVTTSLSGRVFGGGSSVGKVLRLGGKDYRVVGVTSDWGPLPKFYDLGVGYFGGPEQVFIPFTRAVEEKMGPTSLRCLPGSDSGTWEGVLRSECIWIEFWSELPNAIAARQYRELLGNYGATQRHDGRFSWLPRVQLRDVRQWLRYHNVASSEVKLLVIASFSFLFVCVLNVMGLMLARNMARSAEIGTRRALGGARGVIFAQYLTEAGVTGILGAALGLAMTWLGLACCRALLSRSIVLLTKLEAGDVMIAVVLATGVTVIAGLLPTWRAAHVEPALQLKNQ
ncbi:MAG TPA: ABC transporter permease [Steroidobacteraceae bacterium]|nr:ABC transporter permease [Steroidobacteraceae bacterium]